MKAPRTAKALGAGALAASLLLTGCAGGANSATAPAAAVSQSDIDKAMDTDTTLNFWTWVPNIDQEVALFEKKYPKIKVNIQNVGQGPAHYQKVRAAISAGQGAPDVIQLEFAYVSSFQLSNNLLDLAPYGAKDMKNQYVDWVWNQVTRGDKVYGIPQDSGPMGNLYRSDILAKAGLNAAPKTWDDYATAAKTVKDKTGSYITNISPSDAGAFIGLLWQAGIKPFSYSGGQDVGIAIDTDKSQQVAKYWNSLLQQNLVANDPGFTDTWYQGIANGKYAGWLTGAWGPVFLQGTAKTTSGLWRAAPLPQYTADANVSANLGGSGDAVLAGTKNPIAAAKLVEFINSDPTSTALLNSKQSLFPTSTPLLQNPDFTKQEAPFYGGQKVNELFAGVANTVDKTFEWPPFMDYVNSSFKDTLGKAIAEKTDLGAGLTAWQNAMTTYAKAQGFNVK
ncbi:ABC transporter substrate-binding protein [Arthrobacter sp. KNU40]|uniref:ABC transporter substrate-binding protein n=1 Tax=Arthrobacter sp. KNU40 TaxID=3447965 RepID=UPI003F602721